MSEIVRKHIENYVKYIQRIHYYSLLFVNTHHLSLSFDRQDRYTQMTNTPLSPSLTPNPRTSPPLPQYNIDQYAHVSNPAQGGTTRTTLTTEFTPAENDFLRCLQHELQPHFPRWKIDDPLPKLPDPFWAANNKSNSQEIRARRGLIEEKYYAGTLTAQFLFRRLKYSRRNPKTGMHDSQWTPYRVADAYYDLFQCSKANTMIRVGLAAPNTTPVTTPVTTAPETVTLPGTVPTSTRNLNEHLRLRKKYVKRLRRECKRLNSAYVPTKETLMETYTTAWRDIWSRRRIESLDPTVPGNVRQIYERAYYATFKALSARSCELLQQQ